MTEPCADDERLDEEITRLLRRHDEIAGRFAHAVATYGPANAIEILGEEVFLAAHEARLAEQFLTCRRGIAAQHPGLPRAALNRRAVDRVAAQAHRYVRAWTGRRAACPFRAESERAALTAAVRFIERHTPEPA